MRALLFTVAALSAAKCALAKTRPPEQVARTPPRGWSSWVTFRLFPNETLIREVADSMVSTGLLAAGYDTIWIDDGWSACDSYEPGSGRCLQPAPRDAQGKLVPDPVKFPSGMPALSSYVHSKGLKLGIYTGVSARTCGQYLGSLGHEAVDAQTFAVDWSLDAAKLDTCNTDCPVHNGCIANSTLAMWNALDNVTDRDIVMYIDHGNPTSPQLTYNPTNAHVSDPEAILKLATSYNELVWQYCGIPNTATGPRAHMFKLWFDREDNWYSVLTNLHAQIGLSYYQRCGTYLMPDYLTIGNGAQSQEQYYAQFAAWVVLGAPLFLSNDVRNMDPWTLALLTNAEALAINADPLCVQGSLTTSFDATETWIKPLNDSSFAVAVLNKDPLQTLPVTVNFYSSSDRFNPFFPASFVTAALRDVLFSSDLPPANGSFTVMLPPLGGRLYRVTPLS